MHDFARIWDRGEIARRLRFMRRNGFNTLVLHEPGIVDKVVFPALYLGGNSAGKNFFEISRQLDHAILRHAIREFQNAFRHKLLVHLIERAADEGVSVFLEDKELWFKDFLFKSHPEAFRRGFLCPSQPFWWEEFLPEKYAELFIMLPQLAGVVTSFGTGEARLALGNRAHCKCRACRAIDPTAWHRNMVLGMRRPFVAAKRKLIVRDFIFNREEHEDFARAVDRLPTDVGLAMKVTPHDFYPTFPHNPLIARIRRRERWIEYDVHGQYFGWGTAPSIMIDDLRHRLSHAAECGVTGLIARTDWEGTQDHSCFETPNILNLYAAGALARRVTSPARRIYVSWLRNEQLVAAGTSDARLRRCAEWAERTLGRTWQVMKGAVFTRGTVFSDSGTFHVSLSQSAWIAETLHSLKDWQEDSVGALTPAVANARKILSEKRAAVRLAREILAIARGKNPGLEPAAYRRILWHLELLRWYAEGFAHSTAVYVAASLVGSRNSGIDQGRARSALRASVRALRAYERRVRRSRYRRIYPANALLDSDRIACFLKDADAILRRLPSVR